MPMYPFLTKILFKYGVILRPRSMTVIDLKDVKGTSVRRTLYTT